MRTACKDNAKKCVLCVLIILLSVLMDSGAICAEIMDLKSLDLKKREAAAEKIRKYKEQLIMQLIQYASVKVKPLPKPAPEFSDQYPWRDSKHLAIILLGEFRSIESIPILIENIEYKNPENSFVDEPLSIGGWYPASEALKKIGMPAIDPVIEKLGTYDKECQGRKNCVWIIQKVLGIKLGRYKLQLAIEATKDEKVKKNLQAVLPGFKTLQEQLNEERARRDKKKQKQK